MGKKRSYPQKPKKIFKHLIHSLALWVRLFTDKEVKI